RRARRLVVAGPRPALPGPGGGRGDTHGHAVRGLGAGGRAPAGQGVARRARGDLYRVQVDRPAARPGGGPGRDGRGPAMPDRARVRAAPGGLARARARPRPRRGAGSRITRRAPRARGHHVDDRRPRTRAPPLRTRGGVRRPRGAALACDRARSRTHRPPVTRPPDRTRAGGIARRRARRAGPRAPALRGGAGTGGPRDRHVRSRGAVLPTLPARRHAGPPRRRGPGTRTARGRRVRRVHRRGRPPVVPATGRRPAGLVRARAGVGEHRARERPRGPRRGPARPTVGRRLRRRPSPGGHGRPRPPLGGRRAPVAARCRPRPQRPQGARHHRGGPRDRPLVSASGVYPLPPDADPARNVRRLCATTGEVRGIADEVADLSGPGTAAARIAADPGAVRDRLEALTARIRLLACGEDFPSSFDGGPEWGRTLGIAYDWLRLGAHLDTRIPLDEARDLLETGGRQPHEEAPRDDR